MFTPTKRLLGLEGGIQPITKFFKPFCTNSPQAAIGSIPPLRRVPSDSSNNVSKVTTAVTKTTTSDDVTNSMADDARSVPVTGVGDSSVTQESHHEKCVTIDGRGDTSVTLLDDDVIMDDDDDDDDLPEFSKLTATKSGVSKNCDLKESGTNMITPTKQIMTPPRLESPTVNKLPSLNTTSTKTELFSLEKLHTVKKLQMSEVGRMYCMKEEKSKENIKKGGFRQIIEDCENDDEDDDVELSDQLEKQLNKLKNEEMTIETWPPGDVIFGCVSRDSYFTSGLTLRQCGFIQGNSRVDKYLATSNKEQLKVLIKGDILCIGFSRISCKEAFLLWLFNIVSVDEEEDVVRDAHRLIYHIITDCTINWVPALSDVTRVLLNYGTTLSRIFPPGCQLEFTSSDLKLMENTDDGKVTETESEKKIIKELKFLNLQCVIQTISICCKKCWQLYSTSDLKLLIVAICSVSLDKQVIKGVVRYDVEVCLQELLDKFQNEEWPEIMYDLCLLLRDVTEHHHNRLQLVKLVPPSQRGIQLQRRLAYTLLLATMPEQTFSTDGNPDNVNMTSERGPPRREEIVDFKVSCLIHIISELLTIPIKPDSYYKLSSLVLLIDLAVGNEALPKHQRTTLICLENYLRQLTSCVRDNCHNLDTSTIKDLIQRIISKWTFLIRDMGKTQKTLFDHYSMSDCPGRRHTATPVCVEMNLGERGGDSPDGDGDMNTNEDEDIHTNEEGGVSHTDEEGGVSHTNEEGGVSHTNEEGGVSHTNEVGGVSHIKEEDTNLSSAYKL